MNNSDYDQEIWKKILSFYSNDWNVERQENQMEAYWCRPKKEGENQELFRGNPRQRIFARLIKSYQNTTWHQIQLSIPKHDEKNTENKRRFLITDHWFEKSDIIKIAHDEIKENPFFQNLKEDNVFLEFCNSATKIVNSLELREYNFNEVQKENFDNLSKVISDFFEDKCKKRKSKVSAFENIIYKQLQEPYRTIMKMQNLLPGLGVALTCDFLKESHLYNIAKPDVHICHVFSLIDGIPYSMDLPLVKRVSEFAENVCQTMPYDFCNSGAYKIDKIIWMICSDYNTDIDNKKNSLKEGFLKRLAETRNGMIQSI